MINNTPTDIINTGYGRRVWVDSTFYGKSEEEVNEKKINFFKRFPVGGYDTHVIGTTVDSKGIHSIIIRRYSSCD